MKNTELKYKNWVAESTVTLNPRADQFRSLHLFRQDAMYPSIGDSYANRDGNVVRALYYRCAMFITSNINQEPSDNPLDIYIVRLARQRAQSSNVLVNIDDVYRESETTDAVTWPVLPLVTGRMDVDYGRVVKKIRVQPQKVLYPQSGNWQAVDGSSNPVDTDIEPEHRVVSFTIPINKRVRFPGSTEEYPDQLPHHVALFHQPNNFYSSNAHWTLDYCYSKFYFKDV